MYVYFNKYLSKLKAKIIRIVRYYQNCKSVSAQTQINASSINSRHCRKNERYKPILLGKRCHNDEILTAGCTGIKFVKMATAFGASNENCVKGVDISISVVSGLQNVDSKSVSIHHLCTMNKKSWFSQANEFYLQSVKSVMNATLMRKILDWLNADLGICVLHISTFKSVNRLIRVWWAEDRSSFFLQNRVHFYFYCEPCY